MGHASRGDTRTAASCVLCLCGACASAPSVRDRELAGNDRPRARQAAEPREVADERQDAEEDRELQRVADARVRGSTFHSSHSTGCAQHTAQTEP